MPKQLNELIEKKNYEELIFDSEIIVNIALQIKYYWGLLVEKEFIPQEKMAFCQLLIAYKEF